MSSISSGDFATAVGGGVMLQDLKCEVAVAPEYFASTIRLLLHELFHQIYLVRCMMILLFFFSVLYDEVYSNTTMTSFISIQCLERSK